MLESYFRNNADLGTGLVTARFAVTSPPFLTFTPVLSPYFLAFSNFQLHSCIPATSTQC